MAGLVASLIEGTASPEALARAGVAQPAVFRDDWATLSRPRSEGSRRRIASAVLGSARPDAALQGLAELSTPAPGGASPIADLESPGADSLARVLGGADFLARRAGRMPDAVRTVCSAASLPPRSQSDARAPLHELETPLRLDRTGRALRRHRYAEMFRLTARALSGVAAAETTRELSDLADASLAVGLRAVEAAHDVAGMLTVVAMGKLGGRELNYSSDVDVLFAHGVPDADEACHQRLTRAVTSLRSLLSETTEEGFVFRVDLELRPEGRIGPLVNSAEGLVDFYERFGRTWERVAWIRARPCAGDLALGERIVTELRPFVFRRYGSYEVVQNVRDVKQRIEADARGASRNIKLGPGGIREAEFVVQGLQALYGGRHEALRATNTAAALSGLAELGILDAAVASTLADDYDFLRRAENAIQMAEDRQTHEIPADAENLRRLARRLGRADPDGDAAVRQLVHDLDATRARVREAFESLLTEREARVATPGPDADRWRQACGSPKPFAQEVVRAAAPAAVERARPAAERLARAVFAEGGDAADLASSPDAASALGLFLATDPELVSHLIRRPALLRAFGPTSASETIDGPNSTSEGLEPSDDLEAGLDALRGARRDASVQVAARLLRGEASEAELEAALSAAAERVLLGGLALARHHDPQRPNEPASNTPSTVHEPASNTPSTVHEPAHLCILALGKLGSHEMTFHSDLDLVFLYEAREGVEAPVAQEWAARLAQRVILYLTTPTAAGRAYEVDTRLRPSGHGGTLVASLASFRLYHERRAQIWEAQALLRARPVAGDPAFNARVMETVHSALFEFLKYPDLAPEVLRMRSRMERELARTGPRWLDLKHAPGGIVDAEFLAQYIALREGPRRPELRSGSVPAVLEAAGRLGLLRDSADVLGGLERLRRTETSLRLATGRPESALDLEGPLAPLVAELAGAEDVATLAESVRDAQKRLRAIFAREIRTD